MSSANRRRNTRVEFHAVADVNFGGQTFLQRETDNLSLKGVFVKGVNGSVGDNCDIKLHLSGASSDMSLSMKAQVVRADPNGIGLEFYEMDLDSFFHLKNIVLYNSGDPNKLEEEFHDQLRNRIFTS